MSRFLSSIENTVLKHKLIQPGERILVALSGGPDSTSLLHGLYRLYRQQNFIAAVHINHALRGETSNRDAEWVSEHCKALKIKCLSFYINPKQWANRSGESIQMAARRFRYSYLFEAARELKASRLAIGHNSDDSIETILLNLIRGSGRTGLTGIPSKRSLDIHGEEPLEPITLIRPLIETSRTDVMEFLEKEKIPHLTDPSNNSKKYQRNRVRHQILPLLEQENPRIRDRILEMAGILKAEDEWMIDESTLTLDKMLVSIQEGETSINLAHFSTLSIALQRRVLHEILKKFRTAPPEFKTISKIIELTERANPGMGGEKTLSLPGRISVIRDNKHLTFQSVQSKPENTSQNTIAKFNIILPGLTDLHPWGIQIESSFVVPDENFFTTQTSNEAALDADKVGDSLAVRSRKPGDRFHPIGLQGSKKIQDFMVDSQIPRRFRDRIPLLISASGKIAWIIGHRIDDRFKIDPDTKRILCLKVLPITVNSPKN